MDETAERPDAAIRIRYERYRGPLLGYVLHLVGDYQRAEDIVQETMAEAWQRADTLAPDTARPWLFTVAHNLAVSGYRRRSVRPTGEPVDGHEVASRGGDLDPDRQSRQIASALRGLSAEHRGVILELFYRHRTVYQAAAGVGVPPGAVKSRAFYALRALRLALEDHGVLSA